METVQKYFLVTTMEDNPLKVFQQYREAVKFGRRYATMHSTLTKLYSQPMTSTGKFMYLGSLVPFKNNNNNN